MACWLIYFLLCYHLKAGDLTISEQQHKSCSSSGDCARSNKHGCSRAVRKRYIHCSELAVPFETVLPVAAESIFAESAEDDESADPLEASVVVPLQTARIGSMTLVRT